MKHEPSLDILAAVDGGYGDQVADELVDPERVFHAPVATSLIDSLLGSYNAEKVRMELLCAHLQEEGHEGALAHLIAGNAVDFVDFSHGHSKVRRLMNLEGGIKSLNSTYWERALALTDVLEAMPQARRLEWRKMIREMTAPAFEEATVRHTMLDLLNSRGRFFAERVDGIFRNLSREHVTNTPEAFAKRMILSYVLNSYGHVNHDVAGYISDLRNVIARFMGAGECERDRTYSMIERLLKTPGKWKYLDGGALKIKVFKKGTAHLEVHPDMAWRLNAQLAALHPAAIPSQFRQAPRQRAKDFPLLQRTLNRQVLQVIGALQVYKVRDQISVSFCATQSVQGQVQEQVAEVLSALGGSEARSGRWEFDYDPGAVFADLVDSGVMPDERAHQLYETKGDLAQYVYDESGAEDQDTVLEPSAGRGGIASKFSPSQVTCVEVSPQNCKVLEAKGYTAINADFLKWAEECEVAGRRFSIVAMNPPWSDGRARLHTVAASKLVAESGRLVAVLPGSLINKLVLPGFEMRWSKPFERQFAGTDVSAYVLTADKVPG